MLRSFLCLWVLALSAICGFAQDKLIFCNEPERIRDAGAYADARLDADVSYQIFYHYRNVSGDRGEFAIELKSIDGKPFTLTTRQGLADPDDDPPSVGRQAMARFFRANERQIVTPKSSARFSYHVGQRQVASGVLSFRPSRDVRMRIYFKHDRWDAPKMRTVMVDSPRCAVEIPLGDEAMKRTYRIGVPELTRERLPMRDGSYGLIYDFKIAAPEGRRVRITMCPRGGKCGLVGLLAGDLLLTEIYPAFTRRMVAEQAIGPAGYVTLTTSPFGGVFYPVEVTFQLL